MSRCPVCGSIFPDHWPQPIRCPHTRPKNFAANSPLRNPWCVIHERHADRIKSGQWDAEAERRYHDTEWTATIPNLDCQCSENYAEVCKLVDVDWSSAESAFAGMVERHNYVSVNHAQLPAVSLAAALRLWTGPKVAFLTSSYQPIGGTEIFHRMLLPRLRHRVNLLGFAVTAFSGGDGQLLKVPYAVGPEAATALAASADVIVTWGIDTVADLLPSRKQRVISVHHSDSSSEWSNQLQLLPCVDEVVCVNGDAAQHLQKLTSKPIHVIANCVDPWRIQPVTRREDLRNRYQIPQSAKVLLYGHRLSAEKQPRKAVEIAQALPDGWILALVGDGELAAEFRSDDRVRVVGPVASLADWLAACDVFVSLSTYDGYGLSVAEALAFGVPVVSTPRGVAAGRTLSLEPDAPVSAWCAAIVAAAETRPVPQTDLCDIGRFVDQWEQVILGKSPGCSVD